MGTRYENHSLSELPGSIPQPIFAIQIGPESQVSCRCQMLRVFDRYLQNGHIAGWEAIDNALINDFMKSRHRLSPGSYNHLFGVLRRFFAFAIMQEWITVQSRNGESSP